MAITPFKVIQGHRDRYQSKARTDILSRTVRSYRSLLFKFWSLCVFERPFGGGGLGTTYDVHLRLIAKRVVDFLLVLIELFSLGVTAEVPRANIDWKSAISLQRGQFDPKFQVEGYVAPHQPFFLSKKQGKWSFMWCKKCGHNVLSFYHKSRVWRTDGRTDKEFSSL